jgi:uncharacterized protein (DUF433 family)
MATEQRPYADRIVQDPEIMVGKPVIRGTRIPVERIIAHLAHTPDFNDLFAAYPRLTIEDVQAALAFAHEAVVARRKRSRRSSSSDATAAVA